MHKLIEILSDKGMMFFLSILLVLAVLFATSISIIGILQTEKFENLFGVHPQKDAITTGVVLRTLDNSYNDCISRKEHYKRLADNKIHIFDRAMIGSAQQEEITCWESHNEAYSLAQKFGFLK